MQTYFRVDCKNKNETIKLGPYLSFASAMTILLEYTPTMNRVWDSVDVIEFVKTDENEEIDIMTKVKEINAIR